MALRSWDALAATVAKSRAKLGIQLPDDLALPGIDARVVVQALQLELDKAKPIGAVALLHSLMEIEGTALDAIGEFLAGAWLAGPQDSKTRWLVLAAGAIGGPRTAARLGDFLRERLRDNTAHHLVTAVVEALWRMPSLAGAHEILMVAELPSRYGKRRDEARAIFVEIAKRERMSPQELVLRCAPREADAATRERIERVWARRCERMMVDGVRLAMAGVRGDVLAHPIRGPLTSRLVFVACRADRTPRVAFLPGETGPVDATGATVAVTDDELVGVAHPVELAELGVLEVFREALDRRDVEQPFAQLERTVRRLDTGQAGRTILRDYRRFDREWFHDQGWEARGSDGAAEAATFSVTMARDQRTIECRLGNGGIQEVALVRSDRAPAGMLTFGALCAVSQSELLYALLGQDGGPAVGSLPYAELARTSRARCLHCERPIVKNTIRVATERPYSPDAFRSGPMGYVHARCVALYPPLAALADRDTRIAANSQLPWPPG